MRSRPLGSPNDTRTWALIFESGDEVMTTLEEFASRHGIAAAHLTGIGAARRAVVGWYDPEARDYRRTELDEQLEIVSLVGDVTGPAPGRDRPMVHLHAALAAADSTLRGGHLFEAVVRPTLEAFLTVGPGALARRADQASGLALIRLEPDTTGGSHGQDSR